MVEKFSANSNDSRVKPVIELKEEILDNLLKIIEERNTTVDVVANALVNVLAGLVIVAANGDKEKVVNMANKIRYGIISLHDGSN